MLTSSNRQQSTENDHLVTNAVELLTNSQGPYQNIDETVQDIVSQCTHPSVIDPVELSIWQRNKLLEKNRMLLNSE